MLAQRYRKIHPDIYKMLPFWGQKKKLMKLGRNFTPKQCPALAPLGPYTFTN
jgi:hypothetical protein